MRNSLLLTTLLLAIASSDVMAQTVSESEARDKALAFISHGRRAPGHDTYDIELAYTSAIETETHYYVFNYGAEAGGFVIVGGDERAEEILGYSENGPFDYDTAPDNFKWWLSQYDVEIHSRIEQNVPSAKAPRRGAPNRTNIPDLITTKWNQSNPYNSAIAKIDGDSPVTGCVATAMAQVMNYHEWPARGTGSYSYDISYSGGPTVTYSANFGTTNYDWDNMLDTYSSNASEAQKNAVATLMYHAGVSVHMKYNLGSSGANSMNIPGALVKYFGYDKSARYIRRMGYSDEEWADLVYGELAAGRPVLYGGQDAYGGGGHEFVCHGYKDGNFAFNWGWGGYCDGYFSMMGKDGLQPEGSGIGGAGEGGSYTDDQDIIINVMKDNGGVSMHTVSNKETPILYDQSNTATIMATIDLTESETSLHLSVLPVNYSSGNAKVKLGLIFKDKFTGATFNSESTILTSLTGISDDGYYYWSSRKSVYFKTTEFEYNGIYEVYPAYSEDGTNWELMRYDDSWDIPVVIVRGGINLTEDQDIIFEISGTTVEERGTLQITHDKLYSGQINYSQTGTGEVTIDENGVVTGVKAGDVRITVHGEAAVCYKETTAYFDITVTPYVKKDVEFSINESKILIGKNAQITCLSTEYSGTISYRSFNEAVAKVDGSGLITGIAAGSTTIEVIATENELYKETRHTFNITVTDQQIYLVDYSVTNHGYFTPSTVAIQSYFKNATGQSLEHYIITAVLSVSGFTSYYSSSWSSWDNQETLDFDYDWSGYSSYFNSRIGKTGSITFQDPSGNDLYDPIPFTICNEITITPTISSANWGTLCLPFDAEVPAGMTAYSVTGVDGNKLMLEKADMLAMDVPYLVSGTGEYSFTGPDTTPWEAGLQDGLLVGNVSPSTDNSPVYAPAGSYVLQVKNGKLGFYLVEKDNTQKIRQYSAYLQIEEAAPALAGQRAFYFDIDAEGIEEIANDENNYGVAYGINGQRVEANHKGLTVRNGKISFIK